MKLHILFVVVLCLITSASAQESLLEQQSLDAIEQAKADIEELSTFGYSTLYFNDTLLKMIQAFEGLTYEEYLEELQTIDDRFQRRDAIKDINDAKLKGITKFIYDYSKVVELGEELQARKYQAYDLSDSLSLLEKAVQQYGAEGILIEQGQVMYTDARNAFVQEQYDKADRLITQTYEALETAKQEATGLSFLQEASKNFFQRHWKTILITLFILALIAWPLCDRLHHRWLQQRLRQLLLEEQSILALMKKTQDRRFRKKDLSGTGYTLRIEKYKVKHANVKKDIELIKKLLGERKKVQKKKRKGILEVK
jgi:hypothetical protein